MIKAGKDFDAGQTVEIPTPGEGGAHVAVGGSSGGGKTEFLHTVVAQLAPLEAVLLVNRTDRDRIGVADGDRVRATSAKGSVEVAVAADAAIPQGVAFLAANRAGAGIGELVDPTEAVTDLRVETLR